MNTDGKFYLGRTFNTVTSKTSDKPFLYDPDDLTTHGVVVGMTGSGKTGLCIDLLEEAALNNIPAIMIDPKGDITNELLHFPNLSANDFEPWINADEARRDGKTVEQAAQDTADLWRNGLASWEIKPERLQALKDSVHYAVYTPGSDAGLPISILASLAAPAIPWEENRELLREQISGTVTALLGLIGFKNIDPVRSREHILLANIFEHAWSRGKDLDLGELIMQTQAPPFEKLGVFDINRFFPENDRFELAMQLNNMLASPAFQSWIEGEPLDIQELFYGQDGRSRHTIFYIAHLNEAERMFFVTLLYSSIETWMRSQSGSTSLRALVYFDEIFGYLPPVGNPPSKEPMLRMLKQARAFGVGMVLATQNPVDVDYKALSNAGTWFIGKLATEQDKARLLDGLASAVPGGLDTRQYDKMISGLGKRVFLARNVHEKQPVAFQTRWAMNYLAGPVTRTRIPELNELAGSGQWIVDSGQLTVNNAPPKEEGRGEKEEVGVELPGTESRPAVPAGIEEYFLPNNLTLSEAERDNGRLLPSDTQQIGILYRPVLLAQAAIRYMQRKYNLDQEVQQAVLVYEPDRRGNVRWEDYETPAIDPRKLDSRPVTNARYASLEEPLSLAKTVRALKTDFVDWIYRSAEVTVKTNDKLKLFAGSAVSDELFHEMCMDAATEKMQMEMKKVEARFKKKIVAVEKKLTREKRELAEDEAEYKQRKQEEAVKHAETIFGLFTGRRRSVSSSLSKRRMTAKAKADIKESEDAIEEFAREIETIKEDLEDEAVEIESRWEDIAAEVTEISVTPYKKDIDAELFGVAWFPYHLMQSGTRIEELPGFTELKIDH